MVTSSLAIVPTSILLSKFSFLSRANRSVGIYLEVTNIVGLDTVNKDNNNIIFLIEGENALCTVRAVSYTHLFR